MKILTPSAFSLLLYYFTLCKLAFYYVEGGNNTNVTSEKAYESDILTFEYVDGANKTNVTAGEPYGSDNITFEYEEGVNNTNVTADESNVNDKDVLQNVEVLNDTNITSAEPVASGSEIILTVVNKTEYKKNLLPSQRRSALDFQDFRSKGNGFHPLAVGPAKLPTVKISWTESDKSISDDETAINARSHRLRRPKNFQELRNFKEQRKNQNNNNNHKKIVFTDDRQFIPFAEDQETQDNDFQDEQMIVYHGKKYKDSQSFRSKAQQIASKRPFLNQLSTDASKPHEIMYSKFNEMNYNNNGNENENRNVMHQHLTQDRVNKHPENAQQTFNSPNEALQNFHQNIEIARNRENDQGFQTRTLRPKNEEVHTIEDIKSKIGMIKITDEEMRKKKFRNMPVTTRGPSINTEQLRFASSSNKLKADNVHLQMFGQTGKDLSIGNKGRKSHEKRPSKATRTENGDNVLDYKTIGSGNDAIAYVPVTVAPPNVSPSNFGKGRSSNDFNLNRMYSDNFNMQNQGGQRQPPIQNIQQIINIIRNEIAKGLKWKEIIQKPSTESDQALPIQQGMDYKKASPQVNLHQNSVPNQNPQEAVPQNIEYNSFSNGIHQDVKNPFNFRTPSFDNNNHNNNNNNNINPFSENRDHNTANSPPRNMQENHNFVPNFPNNHEIDNQNRNGDFLQTVRHMPKKSNFVPNYPMENNENWNPNQQNTNNNFPHEINNMNNGFVGYAGENNMQNSNPNGNAGPPELVQHFHYPLTGFNDDHTREDEKHFKAIKQMTGISNLMQIPENRQKNFIPNAEIAAPGNGNFKENPININYDLTKDMKEMNLPIELQNLPPCNWEFILNLRDLNGNPIKFEDLNFNSDLTLYPQLRMNDDMHELQKQQNMPNHPDSEPRHLEVDQQQAWNNHNKERTPWPRVVLPDQRYLTSDTATVPLVVPKDNKPRFELKRPVANRMVKTGRQMGHSILQTPQIQVPEASERHFQDMARPTRPARPLTHLIIHNHSTKPIPRARLIPLNKGNGDLRPDFQNPNFTVRV